MKNNRSIKRRGFTLVELLIVIVVIGVLSAMMMLSSTEAVTSARASNIVSNLRNLKTAALSLYASSLDQVKTTEPKIAHVTKYLNSEGVTDDYNIAFAMNGTNNTTDYDNASWYITCTVNDSNVMKKLVARAGTVGLKESSATTGDDITVSTLKDSSTIVCLQVR